MRSWIFCNFQLANVFHSYPENPKSWYTATCRLLCSASDQMFWTVMSVVLRNYCAPSIDAWWIWNFCRMNCSYSCLLLVAEVIFLYTFQTQLHFIPNATPNKIKINQHWKVKQKQVNSSHGDWAPRRIHRRCGTFMQRSPAPYTHFVCSNIQPLGNL